MAVEVGSHQIYSTVPAICAASPPCSPSKWKAMGLPVRSTMVLMKSFSASLEMKRSATEPNEKFISYFGIQNNRRPPPEASGYGVRVR